MGCNVNYPNCYGSFNTRTYVSSQKRDVKMCIFAHNATGHVPGWGSAPNSLQFEDGKCQILVPRRHGMPQEAEGWFWWCVPSCE